MGRESNYQAREVLTMFRGLLFTYRSPDRATTVRALERPRGVTVEHDGITKMSSTLTAAGRPQEVVWLDNTSALVDFGIEWRIVKFSGVEATVSPGLPFRPIAADADSQGRYWTVGKREESFEVRRNGKLMVSEGSARLGWPIEIKSIGRRVFVLHEDGRVSMMDKGGLVEAAPGGGPGQATSFCGWRTNDGFLFLVARLDEANEATFRLFAFPTPGRGG